MNRPSVDWNGGPRRGTLVVLLVVVAVATAGPVALASAGVGDQTTTTGNETANATGTNETANEKTSAPTGNVSFGAEVSSFMSSSAAAASGTVDQGMWNASVDDPNADERALVTERVRTLDQRLADLRERRQALLAAHANGSIPDVAFYARLTAIDARLDQLADATNRTVAVAHRANVTPPGLSALRDAVNSTVRGPPMGNPPVDTPGGGEGPPPGAGDDAANRTNGTTPPGQTAGNASDDATGTSTTGTSTSGDSGSDSGTSTPGDGSEGGTTATPTESMAVGSAYLFHSGPNFTDDETTNTSENRTSEGVDAP